MCVFYGKYFNANNESNWDQCYDVYFYMKVDTEYRGSIQFSMRWSNMLIFGIDNDAIRQASESGIWKLNMKQNNNFLLKDHSETSSVDHMEE